MEYEAKSIGELNVVAGEFLRLLEQREEKNTATVIGLSGNLGTGKTSFTKCVAEILAITEVITSPTFILEKIYDISPDSILGSRFAKLVHIDAYRLEGGDEMVPLGWEAILGEPHNLVFLEWPEQVASALPQDIDTILFEYVSESVRKITMKEYGKK
ncbi:tRNA (adenosine(37)-N6)-threonylcarbamoyltransferase complex ATPase subunit type 1 TsaE [Candidatus Nomurabacteria bacterium CG1_02_43_90]|uniref:tRNA threonylcarbamoyladenosine biosynthesis protein TsaE n=1 Tax=Candidatus Nomurabacteria bacterium CG1_02_43_90 TaxID=1805281 RepID=A0A1J4V5Y9_9BACT|nr:MAG: tRNA (adenosine(37)-N6)-threonylcarbamoyltransferase complex ATPase subunit type 1 TsaE [Candidatus Nomurabacteria bacterium CG1_02_43_90]